MEGKWAAVSLSEDMIQLLGVYEHFTEAVGAGYLFLDERIGDMDDSKNAKITPLSPLEGETGYMLKIIDSGIDWMNKEIVYILSRADDYGMHDDGQ